MMNQRLVLFMMACYAAFSFASEEKEHQPVASRVPTLLTLSLQAMGKCTADKLHAWVYSGNSCQIPLQEVVSDFSKLNHLLKDSTGDHSARTLEHVLGHSALVQHLGIHAAFSSNRSTLLSYAKLTCHDKSGSYLAYVVDNGPEQSTWQVRNIKDRCDVIYEGHSESPIKALCFTDDGNWFAVIGINGVIRLYRLNNFNDVRVFSALSDNTYAETMSHFKIFVTSDVHSVIVGFNFNEMVFSPKMIAIINAEQDKLINELANWKLLGCSADEKSMITYRDGALGGCLRVLDIETGAVRYESANSFGQISPCRRFLYSDIAVSPVANLAAMNELWHQDIIDLANFKKVGELPGHVHAFSDDGSMMSLEVDKKISIRNVESHQCVLQLPAEYLAHTVAFSSDNRRIACTYRQNNYCSTRIVDIATQKMVADFQGFTFRTWISGTPLILLQRFHHHDSAEPQWLESIPNLAYLIVDIENHMILYQGDFNHQLSEELVKYGKILLMRPPIVNCPTISLVSREHELKENLVNAKYDLFNALALNTRLSLLDYILKTGRELFASREDVTMGRYVSHTSSLGNTPVVYSLDCLLKEATQQVLQRMDHQPLNILQTIARYKIMIGAIARGIAYERSQTNPEVPALKRQRTDPQ